MENIPGLKRTAINERMTQVNFEEMSSEGERSGSNPALENILSEGGDEFFQYLSWTGLAKEPNLMVLSSMNHYYYDHNDLAGIKTLINIRRLNQVKHLESFLHTLYRILPSNAYFVGCFKNNAQNRKGVSSYHSAKFLNGILNIFDTRSDLSLSKKGVTRLLEEYGFKVIDITDINGMAYFWAQSLRRQGE